jgi:hypothetical protein
MKFFRIGHCCAHKHVRVAVHVFSERLHDNISPQFQRSLFIIQKMKLFVVQRAWRYLEVRRKEGVVHGQENVIPPMNNGSHLLNVDYFQRRIGGRFDPNHLFGSNQQSCESVLHESTYW